MLRLHYVPGSHGSQGSPKSSSPWCVGHVFLCIQVLLRLVAFSNGQSRYPWQTVGAESSRVHGALHLGPRSATASCTFPYDLPRSVGTSHVWSRLIKFCHVCQVLSSSAKRGRRVVFEPVCAHGIKRDPKAAASIFFCTFNLKI